MRFQKIIKKALGKTLVGGVAMLLLIFSPPSFADDKGTQLAQAVYDRPDGDTSIAKTTMILTKEGAVPRKREFYSFGWDKGDGETMTLIRFVTPADVKDTGLLTHSHADGENDQWLYLPALKRERRIAGDRKGGRFVGSDLYYEDLQDRKVSQDVHTYIGKEKINGVECDVVESVPVKEENSTYSKRKLWIHPSTLIPIRVDFYQGGDTPSKRLKVKKIKKVQDIWTVMAVDIEDLKEKQTTTITLGKITYNVDLPESLFSQSVLQDPSRDAIYRK